MDNPKQLLRFNQQAAALHYSAAFNFFGLDIGLSEN
jgi:hypothetical protein